MNLIGEINSLKLMNVDDKRVHLIIIKDIMRKAFAPKENNSIIDWQDNQGQE